MVSEKQIWQELGTQRDRLIETFSGNTAYIRESERIRAALGSCGLTSTVPLLIIPYTEQGLLQADASSQNLEFHDPFAQDNFIEAIGIRRQIAKGATIYDVGYPTPFYSILLNLAITFDDTDINAETFGQTYAKALHIDATAHELAHSAFSGLSFKKVSQRGSKTIIATTGLIGQTVSESTYGPTGARMSDYVPCWLDEAFAKHMAGQVRKKLFPSSIPQNGRVFDRDNFGDGEIEISPEYLIYSEEYPDQPGDTGGSVAGMGFNELAGKLPNLKQDLLKLSRGKLSPKRFHDQLKKNIGKALYTRIAQSQPYTEWTSILAEIREI